MTVTKSYSRRDRIAEQIRRDLAELIHVEVKDPRIGMISLTGVEVSPDYAHAKVFFSSLSGREHADSVLAGLQKAAGFLRRELGRRLTLRTTPQLDFVFDESLERGADLSELIRQAVSISGEENSRGRCPLELPQQGNDSPAPPVLESRGSGGNHSPRRGLGPRPN